MEITGILRQKLPVKTGTSKTGNAWSKSEFIIETVEQYPKKIFTSLWGDKAAALDQFPEGTLVTISFDVESREYNGNWYTDVRTWKIELAQPQQMTGMQPPVMPQQPVYQQPQFVQQPVYQQPQSFAQQPTYPQAQQPQQPQQPVYPQPQMPQQDFGSYNNAPEDTFSSDGSDDLPF